MGQGLALILAISVAVVALLAAAVIVTFVLRAAGAWPREAYGDSARATGSAKATDPIDHANERDDRIKVAEIEAAAIVSKAEQAAERAAERAAQARQKLDEELAAVTAEARQVRSDLERREVRIAEREQRLDSEMRRLD